jgi:hypothetical protein
LILKLVVRYTCNNKATAIGLGFFSLVEQQNKKHIICFLVLPQKPPQKQKK